MNNQCYAFYKCVTFTDGFYEWKHENFVLFYTLDYLVGFQVLIHSLWNVKKPNLEIFVLLWMELDVVLRLLFFFWSGFVFFHICTLHYHYALLSLFVENSYFLNFSPSIPGEVYILWVIEICLIIPKCFDNKINVKSKNIVSNDLM